MSSSSSMAGPAVEGCSGYVEEGNEKYQRSALHDFWFQLLPLVRLRQNQFFCRAVLSIEEPLRVCLKAQERAWDTFELAHSVVPGLPGCSGKTIRKRGMCRHGSGMGSLGERTQAG